MRAMFLKTMFLTVLVREDHCSIKKSIFYVYRGKSASTSLERADTHMVKHKIDTVQKLASFLLSSNLHLCVCMCSRRETELYFKHL